MPEALGKHAPNTLSRFSHEDDHEHHQEGGSELHSSKTGEKDSLKFALYSNKLSTFPKCLVSSIWVWNILLLPGEYKGSFVRFKGEMCCLLKQQRQLFIYTGLTS